jgi:hypothetical protein
MFYSTDRKESNWAEVGGEGGISLSVNFLVGEVLQKNTKQLNVKQFYSLLIRTSGAVVWGRQDHTPAASSLIPGWWGGQINTAFGPITEHRSQATPFRIIRKICK